jgi:hypothetical protein
VNHRAVFVAALPAFVLWSLVVFPSIAPAAVTSTWANRAAIDSDGDSVFDLVDNAPGTSNIGQEDTDNDLIGDVIDPTPFGSNPNLGDPGLLLGSPSTITAGSNASVPYLTSVIPPGAWGHIDLDLGGDSTFDATYFGPLTTSVNNITIIPSLFTSALWDLNTPGTYTLHAKAFAPGMSSQNVSITNVTVVPEPAAIGFALAAGFAAIARRRRAAR